MATAAVSTPLNMIRPLSLEDRRTGPERRFAGIHRAVTAPAVMMRGSDETHIEVNRNPRI
jgi:hypothetical protein